jgi:hypothetical protein
MLKLSGIRRVPVAGAAFGRCIISLVVAVVSAWTIVASQVFSQATVQNLTLASSLAIAALSLIGLTIHELSSERVFHSLEVGTGRREPELATA